MTVSEDSVKVELRVGMLDLALAKLMTEDHHTIEFPTILLPENVEAGSIVKLQCSRALDAEIEDKTTFDKVQEEILSTFATNLPEAPVLRARNITQTSVVLEWDPIQVASSDLHFVALYKGTQRLGLIPQPLKRTVTKVSNLEIDAPYDFRIVLSTSAGQFESNKLNIKTHKMTDLTGVVVCVGSLANSDFSVEDIEESLKRLGCVPPQENVKLDTTHFVCTTGGGAAFDRATDLNIPIVRPDWLQACENERRLVSVRGFYLSTDPSSYANARSQPRPRETQDLGESPETQNQETQTQETQTQEAQTQEAQTQEAQAQDAQSQTTQETQSAPEAQGLQETPENQDGQENQETKDVQEAQETQETQETHDIQKVEETDAPETQDINSESPIKNHNDTASASEDQNQEVDQANGTEESQEHVDNQAETQDDKVAKEEEFHPEVETQEEESKPLANPDALSSHDELSEAVNNIGDQKTVEEKYQNGESHQGAGESEEHRTQATEVQMDRELERELEEDPSAALHGGEQHSVSLEKSEAVEPQSADVSESNENAPGEEKTEDTAEEPTSKEENSQPAKSSKNKKGKKNKRK